MIQNSGHGWHYQFCVEEINLNEMKKESHKAVTEAGLQVIRQSYHAKRAIRQVSIMSCKAQ